MDTQIENAGRRPMNVEGASWSERLEAVSMHRPAGDFGLVFDAIVEVYGQSSDVIDSLATEGLIDLTFLLTLLGGITNVGSDDDESSEDILNTFKVLGRDEEEDGEDGTDQFPGLTTDTPKDPDSKLPLYDQIVGGTIIGAGWIQGQLREIYDLVYGAASNMGVFGATFFATFVTTFLLFGSILAGILGGVGAALGAMGTLVAGLSAFLGGMVGLAIGMAAATVVGLIFAAIVALVVAIAAAAKANSGKKKKNKKKKKNGIWDPGGQAGGVPPWVATLQSSLHAQGLSVLAGQFPGLDTDFGYGLGGDPYSPQSF